MTATVETSEATPGGSNPASAAPAGRSLNTGELNATPGVVAAPAPSAAGLDIVYGTRDATNCSVCGRHMPAADKPVFELETADGQPLCLVDSDRQHHGLRLVCAVMGYVVESYGSGNKVAAEETIRGFQSAVELLAEIAPKVPYRRPVRQQPVRHGRRRGRR